MSFSTSGGSEMFSRAPYAVTTARWGIVRGTQPFEDMLEWCYRCPFSQEYMGETAENLTEEFQYDREAMDELHELGARHGIEEVHAEKSLALRYRLCQRRDGQGARVGGQHGRRVAIGQLGQHLRLE